MTGSNRRHSACKADALPAELILHGYLIVMTRTGFEPVLPPWKGGVLTAWPTDHYDECLNTILIFVLKQRSIVMGLNGLEPSTSRLSGVRSNQLSYRPQIKLLERVIGIEPTTSAWKAEVLPLNYTRKWWVWTESNRRHLELQSNALPTELQTHKWRSRPGSNRRSPAWQAGMLTATPRDHLVAGIGLEPMTFGLWARRATTAPPRDNIIKLVIDKQKNKRSDVLLSQGETPNYHRR